MAVEKCLVCGGKLHIHPDLFDAECCRTHDPNTNGGGGGSRAFGGLS